MKQMLLATAAMCAVAQRYDLYFMTLRETKTMDLILLVMPLLL